MKCLLILVLLSVLFWTFSCKEETMKKPTNVTFNATIVGEGMDCGDSYLIKFDSTIQGLPENRSDVYYEINLPDEYKIPGRRIAVIFRSPHPDEYRNCTMMGPAYAQIYILSVEGFEQ